MTEMYPSYDKLPRWVAALRIDPLFGTFVSFHISMIMTTARNLRLAKTELSDPLLQDIGEQRLLNVTKGIMAPLILKAAIEGVMRTSLSDEEEEGLSLLMPTWSQNSTRINLGNDGNNFTFIDLTYTDPHSAFRNSGRAIRRYVMDEITDDQLVEELVRSMGGPLVQPDFALQALVQFISGEDPRTGRQVASPADTAEVRAWKHLSAFWNQVQPGVTKKADDIAKAVRGDVRSSGERYELENEAATTLTGHRPITNDIAFSLGQAGVRYAQATRDIKTRLNRDVRDLNEIGLENVVQTYRYVNDRTEAMFLQLRKAYLAAVRLSNDTDEVQRSLIDAVGRDTARRVIAGKYVPIDVSDQTVRDAILRAETMEQRERIKARLAAVRTARVEAARSQTQGE